MGGFLSPLPKRGAFLQGSQRDQLSATIAKQRERLQFPIPTDIQRRLADFSDDRNVSVYGRPLNLLMGLVETGIGPSMGPVPSLVVLWKPPALAGGRMSTWQDLRIIIPSFVNLTDWLPHRAQGPKQSMSDHANDDVHTIRPTEVRA